MNPTNYQFNEPIIAQINNIRTLICLMPSFVTSSILQTTYKIFLVKNQQMMIPVRNQHFSKKN